MSRYMDEENSALFPFGWGLSYTRFSYSQPTISRAEIPVRRSSGRRATSRWPRWAST